MSTIHRSNSFSPSQLPNTGYVVVEGNPQDGWMLLDWNGTTIT